MDAQEIQDAVDAAYGRKIQEWSHADDPDDSDSAGAGSVQDHMVAPDYDPYGQISKSEEDSESAEQPDPYGWIARVTAATAPDAGDAQVQVRPEHVVIWSHGFVEPDKFDHAVARILPNGSLLVMRSDSPVPIKGYAPGVWLTFEHVGEQYHRVRPDSAHVSPSDHARWRQRQEAKDRTLGVVYGAEPTQMTNYLAQAANVTGDPLLGEVARTSALVDPLRRTPPTHESDADDTQSLPKMTQEEGGGVARPKAGGVREDAGRIGRTPRPDIADPEDDKSRRGFWRSLRQSLLNNPDEDD